MNINKVFIRETEIPIQKGTLRLIDFEDEITVEIELNVHPTVINFFNSLDYRKEQALLLSNDTKNKIIGEFEIHIGKNGVLLVGDPNEVKGLENLNPIPYETRPFELEKDKGISITEELRAKENSLFVKFLDTLLKNEINDKENIKFIQTLLNKIQNGEKLNEFDQYIKDEINYLMEEVISLE
ncbi:hypothetical protein [Rummeliibacillus pycnus]|uniref:hypothetical protein n=1 Tax=Rummeliibacillus pycnus TaxID=101070 RepID=UPI000C9B3DA0|nr:hypothetical protein [Rummeliibacillus pycnus]